MKNELDFAGFPKKGYFTIACSEEFAATIKKDFIFTPST